MAINDNEDILGPLRGRYLAVSATLLYGTLMNESHRRAAQFLQAQPPAGRTMTFVIFNFTDRSPVQR
jgi:hypothetical protein